MSLAVLVLHHLQTITRVVVIQFSPFVIIIIIIIVIVIIVSFLRIRSKWFNRSAREFGFTSEFIREFVIIVVIMIDELIEFIMIF